MSSDDDPVDGVNIDRTMDSEHGPATERQNVRNARRAAARTPVLFRSWECWIIRWRENWRPYRRVLASIELSGETAADLARRALVDAGWTVIDGNGQRYVEQEIAAGPGERPFWSGRRMQLSVLNCVKDIELSFPRDPDTFAAKEIGQILARSFVVPESVVLHCGPPFYNSPYRWRLDVAAAQERVTTGALSDEDIIEVESLGLGTLILTRQDDLRRAGQAWSNSDRHDSRLTVLNPASRPTSKRERLALPVVVVIATALGAGSWLLTGWLAQRAGFVGPGNPPGSIWLLFACLVGSLLLSAGVRHVIRWRVQGVVDSKATSVDQPAADKPSARSKRARAKRLSEDQVWSELEGSGEAWVYEFCWVINACAVFGLIGLTARFLQPRLTGEWLLSLAVALVLMLASVIAWSRPGRRRGNAIVRVILSGTSVVVCANSLSLWFTYLFYGGIGLASFSPDLTTRLRLTGASVGVVLAVAVGFGGVAYLVFRRYGPPFSWLLYMTLVATLLTLILSEGRGLSNTGRAATRGGDVPIQERICLKSNDDEVDGIVEVTPGHGISRVWDDYVVLGEDADSRLIRVQLEGADYAILDVPKSRVDTIIGPCPRVR